MKTFHKQRILLRASKMALMIFIGVVLVLWAWNNALTTIFGLPTIQFRESIGLIILALGISFIFRPRRNHNNHLGGESS